ncbi:MAG: amidohydrolase family protein, partial [Micromonosporaceae bacterium]
MTQANHAPGAASGGAHGAIDVHAHLAPRPLLEDLAEGRVRFGHIEVARHEATYKLAFSGGPQTRPVNVGLTDLDKRRKWRGENGLALQVAGGWLDMFGYDLPADEGADWSRLLTDSMIKVTADDPNQAVLGTVPLQAPEAAAQALREQRAAGLPGVMIGTQAAGRDLADPEFTPFWEAADETDAVVFIHPGFGGASPRYQDFGLVNGLARLEDTTVTLARMLYAGIPAKHPRARIVVAHAGAALPYVLGRLVRNHVLHPDTTYDPLESFAKLY